MSHDDEIAITEYFTQAGLLHSHTNANKWNQPKKVEALALKEARRRLQPRSGSALRGRQTGSVLFISMHLPVKDAPRVKVDPGLLEKFLSLTEADDAAICRFAGRYGRLGRFGGISFIRPGLILNVEYCEVWRYFARVMVALLKLASASNRGSDARRHEAWDQIAAAPPIVEERAQEFFDLNETAPHGDAAWSVSIYGLRSEAYRNRKQIVSLLNDLIELARVRPWVLWPDGPGRPRIIYSSPSLFAYLVLQLCLRVGKMDAFVVCDGCQHEYAPAVRAPKAGQRSFCQECRDTGIPQKFALKDYRERRREEKTNG